MNFFGLVEAMEDSLLGLNAIYGWNINAQAAASVKNNPTRLHSDDYELSDFISEHNQLDIALYQWAKGKFSERLSKPLKHPSKNNRPAIAETVDWKTLQFPQYDIEQSNNANG